MSGEHETERSNLQAHLLIAKSADQSASIQHQMPRRGHTRGRHGPVNSADLRLIADTFATSRPLPSLSKQVPWRPDGLGGNEMETPLSAQADDPATSLDIQGFPFFPSNASTDSEDGKPDPTPEQIARNRQQAFTRLTGSQNPPDFAVDCQDIDAELVKSSFKDTSDFIKPNSRGLAGPLRPTRTDYQVDDWGFEKYGKPKTNCVETTRQGYSPPTLIGFDGLRGVDAKPRSNRPFIGKLKQRRRLDKIRALVSTPSAFDTDEYRNTTLGVRSDLLDVQERIRPRENDQEPVTPSLGQLSGTHYINSQQNNHDVGDGDVFLSTPSRLSASRFRSHTKFLKKVSAASSSILKELTRRKRGSLKLTKSRTLVPLRRSPTVTPSRRQRRSIVPRMNTMQHTTMVHRASVGPRRSVIFRSNMQRMDKRLKEKRDAERRLARSRVELRSAEDTAATRAQEDSLSSGGSPPNHGNSVIVTPQHARTSQLSTEAVSSSDSFWSDLAYDGLDPPIPSILSPSVRAAPSSEGPSILLAQESTRVEIRQSEENIAPHSRNYSSLYAMSQPTDDRNNDDRQHLLPVPDVQEFRRTRPRLSGFRSQESVHGESTPNVRRPDSLQRPHNLSPPIPGSRGDHGYEPRRHLISLSEAQRARQNRRLPQEHQATFSRQMPSSQQHNVRSTEQELRSQQPRDIPPLMRGMWNQGDQEWSTMTPASNAPINHVSRAGAEDLNTARRLRAHNLLPEERRELAYRRQEISTPRPIRATATNREILLPSDQRPTIPVEASNQGLALLLQQAAAIGAERVGQALLFQVPQAAEGEPELRGLPFAPIQIQLQQDDQRSIYEYNRNAEQELFAREQDRLELEEEVRVHEATMAQRQRRPTVGHWVGAMGNEDSDDDSPVQSQDEDGEEVQGIIGDTRRYRARPTSPLAPLSEISRPTSPSLASSTFMATMPSDSTELAELGVVQHRSRLSQAETPALGPQLMHRQPTKDLFGERGILGRPATPSSVQRPGRVVESVKKLTGGFGRSLKLFKDISARKSGTRTPIAQMLPVSLSATRQVQLYHDLESLLQDIVGDFLADESRGDRVDELTVSLVRAKLEREGLDPPTGFRFSLFDQLILIRENIDSIHFHGEYNGEYVKIRALIRDWLKLAEKLASRAPNWPDEEIRDVLKNVIAVLRLCGVTPNRFLELERLRGPVIAILEGI